MCFFDAIVYAAAVICIQHPLSTRPTMLRVLLMDQAETPILVLASSSQLALNLLDFGSIVWSHHLFGDENHEQHVNQRTRRDVYQFTVHRNHL